MTMSPEDRDDLCYAKTLLENPGLAARITSVLGAPLERGFDLLPKGWHELVAKATSKALDVAIHSAVLALKRGHGGESANRLHKLFVAGVGAAGGFWGLPAITLELPVSTTVMLRSIADIARSEGHDLDDPLVKVSCVEVFAFGGSQRADDGANSGYFGVRTMLGKAVRDAAEYLAVAKIGEGSAPVLVRLISLVAGRFGVQVTEKIAAQSLPFLGAAGGAMINTLFIDHFQNMARGHFIVLRLEKIYGREVVRRCYGQCSS
ncbi:MAG: EcsC family protein [Desulfopila sp.]